MSQNSTDLTCFMRKPKIMHISYAQSVNGGRTERYRPRNMRENTVGSVSAEISFSFTEHDYVNIPSQQSVHASTACTKTLRQYYRTAYYKLYGHTLLTERRQCDHNQLTPYTTEITRSFVPLHSAR
jgi:hypothetical protein